MKQLISFARGPEYIQCDEIWLPITDNILKDVMPGYYISNCGRIYSKQRNIFLSQNITNKGYCRVGLRTYTDNINHKLSVHRAVLLAFNYVENCSDLQVNHIDGVKTNNHISNLEWATPGQNSIHAYSNGLSHTGKTYKPHNEFTDELAHKTCQLYIQGHTMEQIADILNCGTHGVYSVLNGKSRANISSQYDIQIRNKQRLTSAQKDKLIDMVTEYFNKYKDCQFSGIYPYLCRELSIEDNVLNRNAIYKIYKRRYLRNE